MILPFVPVLLAVSACPACRHRCRPAIVSQRIVRGYRLMVQVRPFVGASATDVEASVATPIEQKVNGVENMIYMKSTNANDGTLTLKVSFAVGTNLDMANVPDAEPRLGGHAQTPQSVKNYGVAVKKGAGVPAAGDLDQVAERDLRQQLPVELRDDYINDEIARHPRAWDRSTCSAGSRLCDARLAPAGSDRQARHHGAGHREHDQTSRTS